MYKLFLLKFTSGGLITAERQCDGVDSGVCVLPALNGCLMYNSVDSSAEGFISDLPLLFSVLFALTSRAVFVCLSFSLFCLGNKCCIIVQMLY